MDNELDRLAEELYAYVRETYADHPELMALNLKILEQEVERVRREDAAARWDA